jgi:homoserine kinase
LVKNCTYSLDKIVPNLGNIAALVMALCSGDLSLLGRSIEDNLVEPLRAAAIPGFYSVKDAALSAGALGCSIAGSGPSMFAFASDDGMAERIGAAMRAAFRSAGLESDLYAGAVSPTGARII